MNQLASILGGIGVLIAIYLFLSNADDTAKIINSVASNSINGIQVLQGRSKSNMTKF